MDDLIKRAENYLTWDDNDPEVLDILQELVERVKELEAALEQIVAIEDKYNCGDWDEIEEARSIASKALGRG